MTDTNHPRTISEWFEYGRQCFQKPDGVEAVKALTKVTDLDPGYRHTDGDNPYFYLGKIYEVEGRLDKAIIFFTRALSIDAWDEESLIGRGSCYTVTHRHNEAVADFSRALSIPKNKRRVASKHLLFVIAENYRQMEDWGQAIHWAKLALNADPGNERHQKLFKMIVAAMKKI